MRKLLIPIAALFLVTGCYEDYVRDFDYAAVYAAYQYDLRTFVLGEGAQFDFSVALGGVMANDRDRAVEITLDESLLTNERHIRCAREAADLIRASAEALDQGAPCDVAAVDLWEARRLLGEITGEDATEAVIDAVFASFCVGK